MPLSDHHTATADVDPAQRYLVNASLSAAIVSE